MSKLDSDSLKLKAKVSKLEKEGQEQRASSGRRLAADSPGVELTHIWLILCGALVMFMQAGFSMLEAGTCRAKNVQNILMKNIIDMCTGTLGWYFFGFGFAFGGPSKDVTDGTITKVQAHTKIT